MEYVDSSHMEKLKKVDGHLHHTSFYWCSITDFLLYRLICLLMSFLFYFSLFFFCLFCFFINQYKRKLQLGCVCFRKVISEKWFFKFFYVCLLLKKFVKEKYFSVKRKFGLVSRKVFSSYFGRKIFFESCEKFRISYYWLIISNLVLKLLIAIYILFWIFVFQFHPL